jgi:hypothetical protein
VQRRLDHWYASASLTDLVDAVQRCTAVGVELHAAGSGWAFEDVAVSANRPGEPAGPEPAAVLMVLTGGSVAVVGSWLPRGGGYGFVAVAGRSRS